MSAAHLGPKPPPYGAPDRPVEKSWATLVAEAALLGVALVRTEDDHGKPLYICTRVAWALTRTCNSIEAVEAFLQRMRGGSGVPP